MKIVLAAVLAGAVVATTNSQAVGELRGLQTSNTCKVYIAVGGACSADDSCVATAFCSSTTSKCATLPGAGAKCGNDIFCAAGLACTAFSGGVCRALPQAGQDCLYGQRGQTRCASGLYCYSEGARNICRSPTTVTTKACSVDLLCPAGQGCMLSATQNCVTSLKENAVCAGNTPGICASGLYCKSSSMTCVKLGINGADCKLDGSASCGSGLSCVPEWFGFKCRKTPITIGAKCVDRCGTIPAKLATATSPAVPAVPLHCRL